MAECPNDIVYYEGYSAIFNNNVHVHTWNLFVFKWACTYHWHPYWIQIVFSNNFPNKLGLLIEQRITFLDFLPKISEFLNVENGWISEWNF